MDHHNPLSRVDLEHVYRLFLDAIDHGKWNALSLKDWKNAAYLMWYGDRMIALEDAFRSRYGVFLQQQARGLRWKSFIRAYLVHFDLHEAYPAIYKEFAGWIVQEGLKHSVCDVWKQHHQRFGLFRTDFSVEQMAAFFMGACASDWDVFIQKASMTGELAVSGYMRAVALILVQCAHHHPETAFRVIPFFVDENSGERRFAALRFRLIDALLLPWVDKKPPEKHQRDVQNWLLDQFGDLRLIARRHQWSGASEDAKAVMRKWLIGETLRQFFEIIDQVAHVEHWQYRKAFWLAYYDQGHIDDAWVIVGDDATRYARRSFGRNFTAGQLVSGRREKTHSVLLLRIGDYVFAEWSHNGKCRAWHKEDAACPTFGGMEYDADEFRTPSMKIVSDYNEDGIIHRNSDRYKWQPKLATFIHHHTGAKVSDHAYRI
ncbi:MAG: hypothetical protein EAZ52_01695 [Alphaproteobacteria bacterium]|nr:MAG: hypothetical protein EAZ52_01695 [Alphaproteobacteria bacterium]